ncbi:MAG: hypothetical protein ABIE22_00655 [archaeon]
MNWYDGLMKRILGGKKKKPATSQGAVPRPTHRPISTGPQEGTITQEMLPKEKKEKPKSAAQIALDQYIERNPHLAKQEQEFEELKQSLVEAESNRKAAYFLIFSKGKDEFGKPQLAQEPYSALTDLRVSYGEKVNNNSFKGLVAIVQTPSGKKKQPLTKKSIYDLFQRIEKAGIKPISLKERLEQARKQQTSFADISPYAPTTSAGEEPYACFKDDPNFYFPGKGQKRPATMPEPEEKEKVDKATGQIVKSKEEIEKEQRRELGVRAYESINNMLGKEFTLLIKDKDGNELYRGKDKAEIYNTLWDRLGQDIYPLNMFYENKSDSTKLHDLIFCNNIRLENHEELQAAYWSRARKEALTLPKD